MANTYSTINSLTRQARRISKRVIISYVFDWILMVALLGLAGGFHYIDAKGSRHAFSLSDPSISYPLIDDLISSAVLYIASVIIPAIIIAAICLLFIDPGSTSGTTAATRNRRRWQRILWELHVGWLGLAFSALGAVAITNALKAMAGKPRPHLLALCNPDLSADSIAKWRVGGLGGLSDGTDELAALITAPIMVTWEICRNTNADDMNNAFSSWPSGHASTSWSGLLYLTFWICAKFGLGFPAPGLRWASLSHSDNNQGTPDITTPPQTLTSTSTTVYPASKTTPNTTTTPPNLRTLGSAPPTYLIILTATPIAAAFFISISRWFDYRHHGFDIISGAILGMFCAWLSFYLYQMPITTGEGWAWAPRGREGAFGRFVARGGRSSGVGAMNARQVDEARAEADSSSGSGSGSGSRGGLSAKGTGIANTEAKADLESQAQDGRSREGWEDVEMRPQSRPY